MRGGGLVAKRYRSRRAARPMRGMKTPGLICIALILSSFAVFLGTAAAAYPDAAREAIEAQSRALSAALQRGDPAAVGALFTENARLSVPGAPRVIAGRAAITGFWRAALANGLTDVVRHTDEVEGEGRLRFETGSYIAFGPNRAEAGRGQFLLVWKKENGTWRIHRDFAHPDPVAAMASVSSVDRAGFPRGYATQFRQLGATLDQASFGLTTVYGNELAASASSAEGTQFPDGAVILMEFAHPQRDGEDQLVRDAQGQPVKGEIAHIDVMRRGAGFGAAYGANRAGEWEFASYRPDGSTLIAPAGAEHCAACHQKAGAGKDYVYRQRSWTPPAPPRG